jgi:antibiotic biosynthesis monooxygenase
MYGRMVRYSYTGDAHQLAQRAEEGVLPIFEAQPGFRAYTLSEADGEIFSLSAWDSKEQAEAASAVVAEWVAENMADDLTLIEARFGEIMFSTTLGVTTKARATA